jgi:hypothetical protein
VPTQSAHFIRKSVIVCISIQKSLNSTGCADVQVLDLKATKDRGRSSSNNWNNICRFKSGNSKQNSREAKWTVDVALFVHYIISHGDDDDGSFRVGTVGWICHKVWEDFLLSRDLTSVNLDGGRLIKWKVCHW